MGVRVNVKIVSHYSFSNMPNILLNCWIIFTQFEGTVSCEDAWMLCCYKAIFFDWLVGFYSLNTIYIKRIPVYHFDIIFSNNMKVYITISIHLGCSIKHTLDTKLDVVFFIPSQSQTLGGIFEWWSCFKSTVTEIQSTRDLPSVWLYGLHSICPQDFS